MTHPTVTGADAASFAVVGDDCPSVLAPGGHCAIEVRFQPIAAGTLTAVLQVADGATAEATLTGRAFMVMGFLPPPIPAPPAALSFGTARLDLGKVKVRQQGKARTLRITNSGGSALLVKRVAVSGKHRKEVGRLESFVAVCFHVAAIVCRLYKLCNGWVLPDSFIETL